MQLMLRRLALVALVSTAAMAACGDDDPAAPGNPRPPVSFSMTGVDANGVSGTATVTGQSGEFSSVTVSLQNLAPGSSHAGHVHRGACATQGAIDFGLAPIVADAQGNGSATTDNVPDALLIPGFYLQYHVALDPPGAPLACADIPDSPAPPPDTGVDGY
jgi:Cu/Zn superoxide dismutase